MSFFVALSVALAPLVAVSLAPDDLAPVALAQGRFDGPGNYDLALAHAGQERHVIVHLPPQARGREPLPALVAYHGGGGNAAGFQAYAGLDAVADRAGAVVVYPDGTGGVGRRLLTFNAGTCCGAARARGADDIGFTWAILRDLARDLPLDATRVYATGHSNGGMMSYRLAVDSAERVAAIAPVAGMMVVDGFRPARAVPVLHAHSVHDPRPLYVGGEGPPFPFTSVRVLHTPVETGLGRWIAHNGCPAQPRIAEERRGTPGERDAAHTAVRRVYAPCTSGADVELWRLTGAGHGWPGGPSVLPERVVGPDTSVIVAAEEVWRFVSRFRRPDAPPLTLAAP